MPLPLLNPGSAVPINSVAHVIQLALTPAFLLSCAGTLLNVFNIRLTRVTDHAEHAAELLDSPDGGREAAPLKAHLRRLQRRTIALDTSVALMAVAYAATCSAAFTVFLGVLRDAAVATALIVLFGVALVCTVGALTDFLVDSVLAWHGLKMEGPLPSPKSVVRNS